MNILQGELRGLIDMPDVVLLKKFSYLSAEDLAMSIPYNDERWNKTSKSGKLWKNTFTPVYNLTEYNIMTHLKRVPELRFFWLCHRICIKMIMSAIILYCKNIRGVGVEWKCGPYKHKREELMSALPGCRNSRFKV
jgi:hypothetical protein